MISERIHNKRTLDGRGASPAYLSRACYYAALITRPKPNLRERIIECLRRSVIIALGSNAKLLVRATRAHVALRKAFASG